MKNFKIIRSHVVLTNR